MWYMQSCAEKSLQIYFWLNQTATRQEGITSAVKGQKAFIEHILEKKTDGLSLEWRNGFMWKFQSSLWTEIGDSDWTFVPFTTLSCQHSPAKSDHLTQPFDMHNIPRWGALNDSSWPSILHHIKWNHLRAVEPAFPPTLFHTEEPL